MRHVARVGEKHARNLKMSLIARESTQTECKTRERVVHARFRDVDKPRQTVYANVIHVSRARYIDILFSEHRLSFSPSFSPDISLVTSIPRRDKRHRPQDGYVDFSARSVGREYKFDIKLASETKSRFCRIRVSSHEIFLICVSEGVKRRRTNDARKH